MIEKMIKRSLKEERLHEGAWFIFLTLTQLQTSLLGVGVTVLVGVGDGTQSLLFKHEPKVCEIP